MTLIKYGVDFIFTFSLLINASLFIPQAIKVYRKKSAKGLSLLTFLGFNFIQLFFALHGYVKGDWMMFVGMGASLITCGMVTVEILIYRRRSECSKG